MLITFDDGTITCSVYGARALHFKCRRASFHVRFGAPAFCRACSPRARAPPVLRSSSCRGDVFVVSHSHRTNVRPSESRPMQGRTVAGRARRLFLDRSLRIQVVLLPLSLSLSQRARACAGRRKDCSVCRIHCIKYRRPQWPPLRLSPILSPHPFFASPHVFNVKWRIKVHRFVA